MNSDWWVLIGLIVWLVGAAIVYLLDAWFEFLDDFSPFMWPVILLILAGAIFIIPFYFIEKLFKKLHSSIRKKRDSLRKAK